MDWHWARVPHTSQEPPVTTPFVTPLCLEILAGGLLSFSLSPSQAAAEVLSDYSKPTYCPLGTHSLQLLAY